MPRGRRALNCMSRQDPEQGQTCEEGGDEEGFAGPRLRFMGPWPPRRALENMNRKLQLSEEEGRVSSDSDKSCDLQSSD